jgi:SAM-dependent methyltransferase
MIFDPSLYSRYSQDISPLGLSDEELKTHFEKTGFKERRIYAATESVGEKLSMQYFRGMGLEIGAGNHPIKLFGDAACLYADIDDKSPYKTSGPTTKIILDISDSNTMKAREDLHQAFNFVIASHVLEHCNSIVQTLKSLEMLLKHDGVLYLVVPNRNKDWDKDWTDVFSILHHVVEAFFPKIYLSRHRASFAKYFKKIDSTGGFWAKEFEANKDVILNDQLKLMGLDYIYHKHAYNPEGWLKTIYSVIKLFGINIELLHVEASPLRNDIHFIFQKI